MAKSKPVGKEELIVAVAKNFGYEQLKDEQKRVIGQFVDGHDLFACLPTGFGKSACFILLPMIFDGLFPGKRSVVLVISPLTSLMKDQVASCIAQGVRAVSINHESLDKTLTVEELATGDNQVIYMSPEMILGTKKWRSLFENTEFSGRLCAVVIDEAHCVRKWGGTFRPVYDDIGDIRSLVPLSVHMMALTATATRALRQEICAKLGMKDYILVERSPDRANIFLSCQQFISIPETFNSIALQLKHAERRDMGRILIFCKKRLLCSQIYSFFQFVLRENFCDPPGWTDTADNRVVDMFTSGTEACVKEKILENFKKPASPLKVVVATIAFGMGIDCCDIRKIIHIGPPEDIESYVQHIGRCGRDGKESSAIMFFGKNLMKNTSKSLIKYCHTSECRRNFLFSHFDCFKVNTAGCTCKCCDNCATTCSCGKCTG